MAQEFVGRDMATGDFHIVAVDSEGKLITSGSAAAASMDLSALDDKVDELRARVEYLIGLVEAM